MTSYLLLALTFGADLGEKFLFGLLLSFLAAFSLVSFFYLFHSLSLLFQLRVAMEEMLHFVSLGGKYPTFIYKSILSLALNVIIPSFAYGSLPIYFYKFETLDIFLYSIPFSVVFLVLGEILRRIAWKRFEAYGT